MLDEHGQRGGRGMVGCAFVPYLASILFQNGRSSTRSIYFTTYRNNYASLTCLLLCSLRLWARWA